MHVNKAIGERSATDTYTVILCNLRTHTQNHRQIHRLIHRITNNSVCKSNGKLPFWTLQVTNQKL